MKACRFVFLLIAAAASAVGATELPRTLAETGLHAGLHKEGLLEFEPEYPLWSDGTRKRRWLYLPPGTAIDASDPDAWQFPVGTRAWKEFGYGRRVETRFIERLPGGAWRFAAYVWNEQGSDAVLAPEDGATLAVADAPRGRYAVPSRTDCLACHEGAPAPILGFSAVQLSRELRALVEQGKVRNLPRPLVANPPRIPAASATERAALGYLHGNCGHCHNDTGPLASAEVRLAQKASGAQPVRFPAQELKRRLRATNPYVRMPPLGVAVPDAEGIALVERWLHHDPTTRKELSP
jgi:hypothetical protein